MKTKEDALSNLSRAVNGLLDRGRHGAAVNLAFAAALKAPENRVLASLLEKALACLPAPGAAENIYARLFKFKNACPAHYYHLAMYYKRIGDYRKMRQAFSGFLKVAGKADLVNSYIALCTLDRYGEAFATAEKILDAPGSEPVLSRLWNPWGDRSTQAPPGFLDGRLSALEKAEIPEQHEHYRTFFRGALLFYMRRYRQALLAFKKMPALRADRYSWMHFPEGWAALLSGLFPAALEAFRKSAVSPVSRIQSLGRMAEVYICSGRRAEGLACLDKALKEAHFSQLPGLNAWKGQMLLFTGAYKDAAEYLSEGARLGDDVAFCWRGAAYAGLGRLEEALADLEKAVKLFPTDLEALVWKGEVLRLSGRKREALEDLARVLEKNPEHPWALINRALALGALGDNKGMESDYRKIDREITCFLEAGEKLKPGRCGGRIKELLEKACRLAMGNRRDDRYFYPIWLRKTDRARKES